MFRPVALSIILMALLYRHLTDRRQRAFFEGLSPSSDMLAGVQSVVKLSLVSMRCHHYRGTPVALDRPRVDFWRFTRCSNTSLSKALARGRLPAN